MKLKKGMNVAHVEASQVVPLFNNPLEKENVYGEITKDVTKESKFRNSPKRKTKECQKF